MSEHVSTSRRHLASASVSLAALHCNFETIWYLLPGEDLGYRGSAVLRFAAHVSLADFVGTCLCAVGRWAGRGTL
eukprot:3222550-Amphidinium_carterae.1